MKGKRPEVFGGPGGVFINMGDASACLNIRGKF